MGLSAREDLLLDVMGYIRRVQGGMINAFQFLLVYIRLLLIRSPTLRDFSFILWINFPIRKLGYSYAFTCRIISLGLVLLASLIQRVQKDISYIFTNLLSSLIRRNKGTKGPRD